MFDKRGGDDGTDVIPTSELNDLFARLVLRSKGESDECPTTYAEIAAKLRKTDNEGCEGVRDGLRTSVVSETSQVTGKAGSYRTVTSRRCDGRSSHELLFSMFGITGKSKELPADVEVISFDSSSDGFSFYAIENGEMNFFGTSNEFMTGEGGRCKNCHPGGGLTMKEIDAPWLHWEGRATTPGVKKLIDTFDDLGSRADGIELEGIVNTGNQALVEGRVRTLLATGDLKQVLRPLFCTVQINIAETDTMDRTPTEIPAQPFVGSFAFASVPVTADQYKAALKASGQRIVGPDGTTQLKDKQGNPAVDTFFPFVFVKKGREDVLYLGELERQGVIDRDFRNAVLAVDITRPVFSDARCSLLDEAPKLTKLTTSTGKPVSGLAKKIRDGFLDNLDDAKEDSAREQLRTNLGEGAAKAADVGAAFMAACKARPVDEFLADAFKVISLQRTLARKMPIMEFPSSMPVDDLEVDPGTFFDPETCTLVVPKP